MLISIYLRCQTQASTTNLKKIGATHNCHLAQDFNTTRQMNKETDLELPLL